MKDKIILIFNKVLTWIKPKLTIVDQKVNVLVPNPKMKKVLYITLGSLFGFIFLIILLGILVSPLRNQNQTIGTMLNKPNIVSATTEPQRELSPTEKEILNLEVKIKEMTFPESILNIPVIEKGLSI